MGQPLGATKIHTVLGRRVKKKQKERMRRRSSNVYCPHNGVLCKEEDLTLSAVCSTCAQAHLAQAHLAQNELPNPTSTITSTSASNKILVNSSSSSSSSSTKLNTKRVVFVVPPLTEAEQHTVVAEE